MADSAIPRYSQDMKTDDRKKVLTLGEFVAGAYEEYGNQMAEGIVRLAIKARWVEFFDRDPGLILRHGSGRPRHSYE
jgi:hypothetical protein